MTPEDFSSLTLMYSLEDHISAKDPFQAYIEDLPNEPPMYARSMAEDTVRLREQFVDAIQIMLTDPDLYVANANAAWVSKHAQDVAYKWASLRKAYQRHVERGPLEPMRFVLVNR